MTTEWLAAHLDDPNLVVVDMRWTGDSSARRAYERAHIPGALHLDWSTDLVDPGASVAFMLAPPEVFAQAMARCGIGEGTDVVAYADARGNGPFRLWWASGVYGHDGVRVLDGGFDKWSAEGRPLSDEPPSKRSPPASRWRPGPNMGRVARPEDVLAARSDPDAVVLDSRPTEQFLGRAVWFETGPVPADEDGMAHTSRGSIQAGRVPWARNIPWQELYRLDHTFKSPEELRAIFAQAGATPDKRVITYCGCGISASALLFAARLAGIEDATLYDASWEEWGRDPTLPVTRG